MTVRDSCRQPSKGRTLWCWGRFAQADQRPYQRTMIDIVSWSMGKEFGSISHRHIIVTRQFRLSLSHYDVVAASSQSSWLNPPFELTGLNGYLYVLGASVNKGPWLASAWADAVFRS